MRSSKSDETWDDVNTMLAYHGVVNMKAVYVSVGMCRLFITYFHILHIRNTWYSMCYALYGKPTSSTHQAFIEKRAAKWKDCWVKLAPAGNLPFCCIQESSIKMMSGKLEGKLIGFGEHDWLHLILWTKKNSAWCATRKISHFWIGLSRSCMKFLLSTSTLSFEPWFPFHASICWKPFGFPLNYSAFLHSFFWRRPSAKVGIVFSQSRQVPRPQNGWICDFTGGWVILNFELKFAG